MRILKLLSNFIFILMIFILVFEFCTKGVSLGWVLSSIGVLVLFCIHLGIEYRLHRHRRLGDN